MSDKTVYLISGANRGLGLGFVKALVARPSTIVFAGARDPSKADELNALARDNSNKLYVIKLVSADLGTSTKAVDFIEKTAGKLDVVIANAGIFSGFNPIKDFPVDGIMEHFQVNSIGPLLLFQSTYRLLVKSPTKKFVLISSGAASLQYAVQNKNAGYNGSKTAANMFIRMIHVEHEADGITTFALHPGWVATDMGNGGKDMLAQLGLKEAPVKIDDSITNCLKRIDEATREKTGGKFINFKRGNESPFDIDSDEVPW